MPVSFANKTKYLAPELKPWGLISLFNIKVHILLRSAKMSVHAEYHVLPSGAHYEGSLPPQGNQHLLLNLHAAQIYLVQKTMQLSLWMHGRVSLSLAQVMNSLFLSQVMQLVRGMGRWTHGYALLCLQVSLRGRGTMLHGCREQSKAKGEVFLAGSSWKYKPLLQLILLLQKDTTRAGHEVSTKRK